MVKMIVRNGDLLKNVSNGHIVSGCNAQGVMGSGFALAIKKMYPGAFADYIKHHNTAQGLTLGVAYPYAVNDKLTIWNAITQEGFGQPFRNVSYDAIETCFAQINESIHTDQESVGRMEHSPEIHIPMIGAGLGGGNWNIIRTIIEETVDYPTTVWVL